MVILILYMVIFLDISFFKISKEYGLISSNISIIYNGKNHQIIFLNLFFIENPINFMKLCKK